MKTIALTLSALTAMVLASPSYADLQVQFIEGAPKDRFVIKNIGACDLGAAEFVIDFAASNAGLIFDVTGEGAGVEVFQPFEITAGAQYFSNMPTVSDGDQRATLSLNGLGQGETIAFTIDVDDTGGSREITVSDSEISGTTVSLRAGSETYNGVMNEDAQVVVNSADCDV